jgi:small-conductance mechanosensitive channel
VVLRELRRRVKKAFDKADIEIPFPHIKIVRDRDGAA